MGVSLSTEPVMATYFCLPYDGEQVYDDYVDAVIAPFGRLCKQSEGRRLGVLSLNKFNYLLLREALDWTAFVAVVQYSPEDAGLVRTALRRIDYVYHGTEFYRRGLSSPAEFDLALRGSGFRQVFEPIEDYRSTLLSKIRSKDLTWGTGLVNARAAGWIASGDQIEQTLESLKKGH